MVFWRFSAPSLNFVPHMQHTQKRIALTVATSKQASYNNNNSNIKLITTKNYCQWQHSCKLLLPQRGIFLFWYVRVCAYRYLLFLLQLELLLLLCLPLLANCLLVILAHPYFFLQSRAQRSMPLFDFCQLTNHSCQSTHARIHTHTPISIYNSNSLLCCLLVLCSIHSFVACNWHLFAFMCIFSQKRYCIQTNK